MNWTKFCTYQRTEGKGTSGQVTAWDQESVRISPQYSHQSSFDHISERLWTDIVLLLFNHTNWEYALQISDWYTLITLWGHFSNSAFCFQAAGIGHQCVVGANGQHHWGTSRQRAPPSSGPQVASGILTRRHQTLRIPTRHHWAPPGTIPHLLAPGMPFLPMPMLSDEWWPLKLIPRRQRNTPEFPVLCVFSFHALSIFAYARSSKLSGFFFILQWNASGSCSFPIYFPSKT